MTTEIAIVLALLISAMVLYTTEWVSVDIVALGLLAALMLFGILTPAEAFASEIVVVLAAIMVLAGAIVNAGIITPRQGLLTLIAMLVAVLVGALGILPFSLSILIALLTVVLAGGLTMQEAYSLIEWRLLVLIASMSGFGLAMESSGTAEYLAENVVDAAAPFGPSPRWPHFVLWPCF